MIIKCEWCNKEFNVTPSRLKNKHICCSKQCASELKKSMTELNCVCEVCGKRFHRKASHCYNHIYCSMKCCAEALKVNMLGEKNHQFGLKGNLNSSWKSDIRHTNYGYIKIRVWEHPYHDYAGFVFEHRLVAETYYLTTDNSIMIDGKYYLKRDYVVHHVDMNKLNNTPQNLIVLTLSEHTALHCYLNEGDMQTYIQLCNTYKNRQHTNNICVNSNMYMGEYIVALHNDSDEPRVVENGQRIAQVTFVNYHQAKFEEVENLTETARNDGSFGSTGK